MTGDQKKYWGTDEEDFSKFNFPGISIDVSQYMVDALGIKGT